MTAARERRLGFLYLPRNAWVLGASSAVWAIGGSIVNPYQSVFFSALGTPLVYIGVLGAVSSVVTAVMYLIGGYIADARGRRGVITTFSFLAVGVAFIYIFIDNWPLLFIPVILGALSGIYTPAFNAVLNDSMEPNLRPIGFASFTIISTIPSLFSPYIGGVLMERIGVVEGLKLGYFISGVLGLVGVSWRAMKLEETYAPKKRVKVGLMDFVKGVIRDNAHALREANLEAKKLIVYAGLTSVATGLSTLYISLYLIKGISLPPSVYGLLTGVSALTTILLLLPAANFVNRVGLKKAAVLSALSSPLSMLVFVSANGMNDLITWSVTGGVSGALVSPTIQSLQGNTVPKQIRGRLMAMFNIVPLLVTTPAQIASGYLYTYVSHVAPFIVSIPFYVASIIVLTTIRVSKNASEY
jgi:MFS family permease